MQALYSVRADFLYLWQPLYTRQREMNQVYFLIMISLKLLSVRSRRKRQENFIRQLGRVDNQTEKEEKGMLHVVIVGICEDSIEIVKQALDELEQSVIIDAVVFDQVLYSAGFEISYPVKTIEDLPQMIFDKLLVCANEEIVNDAVKMFRNTLKLSEQQCGAFITKKIGPHKINWDVVKDNRSLVEQIMQSGTLNALESFFYFKPHRLIFKWLHYFEVYDRHFSKYRNKAPVVMEIGVYKGGSLQMWKEYFGEGAQIIGVDIDESTKEFEEEQILVEIGSQEDRNFLKYLKEKYPKIDILIDDGGHTMNQQITTFEEMFTHLSYGGVYLCEDLHTSYMPDYGGGYRNSNSYIEYSKNFIDYIHAWYSNRKDILQPNQYSRSMHSLHYYDSVLVIEKEKMAPAISLSIER